MLELACVTKTDVVYDLGCGDGRIVIASAKYFGSRGIGIDIDPQRISEANEAARKNGVEHLVAFETGDLFQTNLSEATVVMLFLWPHMNLRLCSKFLNELKPGSRIVSNTFDMGDWNPDKEVQVIGSSNSGSTWSRFLYLWTIPPQD